MIGANVGYYELPKGGFNARFPADQPPAWLQQMVASSHVHALFSQVEDLVRHGDLLPGPMHHTLSTSDPAYEFPTGDVNVRVLVRKHRQQPAWLITAWVAEGADRPAQVFIPELGVIKVSARACGSVYRATLEKNAVTLTQLDPGGATYTAVKTAPAVRHPVDLTIPPPTTEGQLVWLSADRGITKDAAGKVSGWQSGSSSAIAFAQPAEEKRPQWKVDAINGHPALQFQRDKQWVAFRQMDAATGGSFVGDITVFAVFTGASPKGNNRVLSANSDQGHDYETAFYLSDGGTAIPEGGALLKHSNHTIKRPLTTLAVGAMCNGNGAGIGGNGSGFGGGLAEVVIYKGKLSASAASLVTQYLNHKYGLSQP